MKTFRLAVVAPDAVYPDREVRALDVPAHDGRLTVLAGHQPHVAALGTGEAQITRDDGHTETLAVHGGVLSVEPGIVTLLLRERS